MAAARRIDPGLAAELSGNPNVLRVTERSVEYRDEFKHKAVLEYLAGKGRRQIFEEAGLDVDAIGMERIRSAFGNWLTKWKRGQPVAGRKGRPPAPPASRRSSRRRRRGSRGLCRPWSSTANYEGRTGVTSRTNNRRKVRGDKGLHLLTDVSYVRYGPGGSRLCYLSAVKDASTNEILAWELSESYGSGFVLRTVAALASLDWLPDQALLHSDQGCHYASKAYRSSLRAMGMAQSMSRRGNRWDNAPMESWFGHAKDEIPLEGRGSFREVRALVADYVDYYNNERPQAGLGGMTPRERRDYLLSLPSMLPAVVPGTKENPSGVPA